VHRVLEELFKPWIGLQPGSEDIRGMQSRAEGHTHRAFLSEFSGREHSDGRNHLLYHQAVELVNHFLRAEAARVAETAFPPKIIALEDQVIVNYELGIPETGDLLKVKLRGKSDRIEEVAGERRVIDYKTGKVEAKELIFSGSDKVDSPKGDKIFQLMFYELLYHIHAPDLPVRMMILSLRNLSEGPLLLKGEMGEWTEMDRERFKEYLNGMLISMLDRDIPFSPTEDTDHCKYCDFRELCYRTGKSEA
ncbi:MAG: PD-(D/E)XK nuclease family protein, partial [Bacteroidales bacterium]|nr:PD-(D/E)XK nuclease family protein [Bacteroidales bacterium]